MHWLIINTETFSASGKGLKEQKELSFGNLPRILLLFIRFFNYPYIILDECFVAGTLVDTLVDGVVRSRCIESILEGDTIYNAFGRDTVVGTSRKKVSRIVEIYAGGGLFACSKNHPFLTVHGWRRAEDIRAGDMLVPTAEAVRILRGSVRTKTPGREATAVLQWSLLREVEDETAFREGTGLYRETEQENIEGSKGVYDVRFGVGKEPVEADNRALPDDGRGVGAAYDGNKGTERNAPQSTTTGWERSTDTTTGEKTQASAWERLVCGIRCLTRETTGRLSNLLQVGLSITTLNARNRARWVLAHRKAASTRQEEGREARYVRVDSAQVLEQGDSRLDKYRDADGELYCYDIKAARHHSFSVNGVLVHNCSKIKTNTPMPEHKKSTRCRLIKQLNGTGERTIMTGTLKSKSPLNVYDQFGFLDPSIFPESMYEFAERYCIMITIRVGRGRRVCISQKDYTKIRNRLVNAFNRRGEMGLTFTKASLFKEYTIDDYNLEWIMDHKDYTPFIHQDELYRRIKPYTTIVKREDVFDITHEKFVHDPIIRYVDIPAKAKALGNELINLGFTDNMVLGKAASLELMLRLQDVCNGFEPIEHIEKGAGKDGKDVRTFTYNPLPENPKLEELHALLEEIDVEENQVAVVATRLNILEAVQESFDSAGITYVRYEEGNKEEAKEAILSGEAQVFVSTITTCAYGLNCLADLDYIIVLCEDNRTEDFYQLKHRILRGQLDHPKFMYIIAVRNSIEERIITSLKVGSELINDTNTRDLFAFA